MPAPFVFVVGEGSFDIFHAPGAVHLAEEVLLLDSIAEGDVLEDQLAAQVGQRQRAGFFSDLDGQVDDFEDALEADHRCGKLDRGVGKTLQGSVQVAEVCTEGDDGADGEHVADDEIAAQAVDQGSADSADQADDHKEGGAGDRTKDAQVADARRAVLEAFDLHARAAKELDQQRAADVERLVHHGVHARVGFHLLARDIAQPPTQAAGGKDKEGQDEDADEGQAPLESEHDNEDSGNLDDIGEDADQGIGDGVLRADHIIIQAAHQLADSGIGEKTQRHALKAGEEAHAQIINDALADIGIQAALDHVDKAAQDGDEPGGQRQPDQALEVAGWDGAVDQVAHDQGGDQRQPGVEEDHGEHADHVPAVRSRVLQDTAHELPGDFRFFAAGADDAPPAAIPGHKALLE